MEVGKIGQWDLYLQAYIWAIFLLQAFGQDSDGIALNLIMIEGIPFVPDGRSVPRTVPGVGVHTQYLSFVCPYVISFKNQWDHDQLLITLALYFWKRI